MKITVIVQNKKSDQILVVIPPMCNISLVKSDNTACSWPMPYENPAIMETITHPGDSVGPENKRAFLWVIHGWLQGCHTSPKHVDRIFYARIFWLIKCMTITMHMKYWPTKPIKYEKYYLRDKKGTNAWKPLVTPCENLFKWNL